MNEDYDPYDIPDREEAQNPNTYAEFEKQQQRRRQMDIENMQIWIRKIMTNGKISKRKPEE